MTCLRTLIAADVLVCLLECACTGQPPKTEALPSAASVMARVATNQDQAEAERSHYVYVQHAKMVSRRGSTVMCEELTDYRMTPTIDGSHAELLKLDGRQLTNHKYLNYTALPPEKNKAESHNSEEQDGKNADNGKPSDKTKAAGEDKDKDKKDEQERDTISVTIRDDSMDRDIVENMRWNLIHDKSKDGVSAHLFPLTSKDQADYAFRMVGREHLNGRDVFHISFRPENTHDFGWSGDAYIDTTAFQPVLVTTAMARKIPFAVRTFLGTNLPGLGFTITYAPQPDGVWFPATFSTEFKIHVLFFFHREIILDAQNREFEKTHVTSTIVGDATPVEPQGP